MATVHEEAPAVFEGFAGELLRSGDSGYEEARQVHNGLIDRRPALIARCRGTADVVQAVAVVLGRHELRDEVVLRLLASFLRQSPEVQHQIHRR